MGTYEDVQNVCSFIKSRISRIPRVAIICGSGLGKIAETLTNQLIIEYSEIKEFPKSTVVGHAGNLVFGDIGGKYVMAMEGRFHPYEGHDMTKITLPIRVIKTLGVEFLFVTNAAGGLNPDYKVGDMMIIKDHINISGLVGINPLVGPNDERFGPRFPALSRAYPRELRTLAKKVAKEMGILDCLREGVYIAQIGPAYETPAEARYFKMIGADAAGMSTTHEVVVATHAGLKVFAMSLITNCIIMDIDAEVACSHEEVIQTGSRRSDTMKAFIAKMVELL